MIITLTPVNNGKKTKKTKKRFLSLSATDLPPARTPFSLNARESAVTLKSMPMVEMKDPDRNVPSLNLVRMQVFPTHESPISITCNS